MISSNRYHADDKRRFMKAFNDLEMMKPEPLDCETRPI